MASFTEQAVLKVVDQSSSQISKINAQLRQLAATARSLRSTTVDFKFNAAAINQALAQMRRLQATARTPATVNVRVNTSGIAAATRQIQQLRTQRPITVPTVVPPRGPG